MNTLTVRILAALARLGETCSLLGRIAWFWVRVGWNTLGAGWERAVLRPMRRAARHAQAQAHPHPPRAGHATDSAEPAYEPPAPPPATALYAHTPHPHTTRNVNDVRRAQRGAKWAQGGVRGFNARLATWTTAKVGTMGCAYIFAAIGTATLLGVFGAFGGVSGLVAAVGGAVSSYWLQLVLLPTIMVGQNEQSRQAEELADEMYHTTVKAEHHIVEVMHHLSAQDEELLRQTAELLRQTPMLAEILAVVRALPGGDALAYDERATAIALPAVPTTPARRASRAKTKQQTPEGTATT